MTRASRVVRPGGSPDTQAALDTVGMSWTSASIACHEQVGILEERQIIGSMSASAAHLSAIYRVVRLGEESV